jgi:hypothetical protein
VIKAVLKREGITSTVVHRWPEDRIGRPVADAIGQSGFFEQHHDFWSA